jgi:FkbM family methyltransferase
MRTIFLDVGAHTGETLRAVLDPKYRFDHVVCFEPVKSCCRELRRFRDPRLKVCEFGLLDHNTRARIFDAGEVGASVFEDKTGGAVSEWADFVRAGDWFKENLSTDDLVYMKLNCEGSEVSILEDLMNTGEIGKVAFALVHFDVGKIPSQRHREKPLWARLRAEATSCLVYDFEEIEKGPTFVSTMQNWLDGTGARKKGEIGVRGVVISKLRWIRYVGVPYLMMRSRVGRVARRILPRAVHHTLLPVWRRLCKGF